MKFTSAAIDLAFFAAPIAVLGAESKRRYRNLFVPKRLEDVKQRIGNVEAHIESSNVNSNEAEMDELWNDDVNIDAGILLDKGASRSLDLNTKAAQTHGIDQDATARVSDNTEAGVLGDAGNDTDLQTTRFLQRLKRNNLREPENVGRKSASDFSGNSSDALNSKRDRQLQSDCSCVGDYDAIPASEDFAALVTNCLMDATCPYGSDLNCWDTSLVTDMSNAFGGYPYANDPIDCWDVSQVTNMRKMFYDAYEFNQPLDSWDVGKVNDMSYLFCYAYEFNQALDSWDVGQVTNMIYMFTGYDYDYPNSFNQDLSSWNVGQVTSMAGMFFYATSFDQALNSWNVGEVTDMKYMFYYASSFDQALSSWDVGKVTNMEQMFLYATNFNQALNSWNVGEVTDMRYMFFFAYTFNQALDSWDVSKVTDMRDMFYDAYAFNQPFIRHSIG